MDLLRFRYQAMATCFEFVVAHQDRAYAQAAADAAFADIERIEAELSRFRGGSDPDRIRRLRPGESTRIGLATFDCLSLARDVHLATHGAFDVTLTPLYDYWMQGAGAAPPVAGSLAPAPDARDDLAGDSRTAPPPLASEEGPSESAAAPRASGEGSSFDSARSRTGMDRFELDADRLSLRSLVEGLALDFGGIGKGYALDQAACVFQEWDISSVLLNAGDSTVLALAPPADARNWLVGAGEEASAPVPLRERALSGSGSAVKGSHIIDPRSGRPVAVGRGRDQMWAAAPSAALADALSTAFIVMQDQEIAALCREYEGEVETLYL